MVPFDEDEAVVAEVQHEAMRLAEVGGEEAVLVLVVALLSANLV
jgi:hypothetical protein